MTLLFVLAPQNEPDPVPFVCGGCLWGRNDVESDRRRDASTIVFAASRELELITRNRWFPVLRHVRYGELTPVIVPTSL